jgi:hypothetical protein
MSPFIKIILTSTIEFDYHINILSLISFVRMNFSEQYNIEGKVQDVRWDEKSITSKTYQ